jgi:hypothetical protein
MRLVLRKFRGTLGRRLTTTKIINKLIINQDVLLRTTMKSTILTKQRQGPIHKIEKVLFVWIKMIKWLERLKILLINIWPTYDQIDLRPVTQNGSRSLSRWPSVFTNTNGEVFSVTHTHRCIYYFAHKMVRPKLAIIRWHVRNIQMMTEFYNVTVILWIWKCIS